MDKLITNFSVKNATDFFFAKFPSFNSEHEDFSHLLKDDRFSQLEKIGEAKLELGDDIIMFTCKSENDLTERSSKKSQYEIARKLLNEERMDSAIAIFYDQNGNFRFSFVRKYYGDAEKKISTWKRFTYFVTKEQTNKTFRQRTETADFSSLDKIQEAFNVEKLTKQFYDELFEWYLSALSDEKGIVVQFPNDTSVDDDNRKIEEHLIRLITRLIFVWFIRKKKLVPDAIFDKKELDNILESFDPESKTDGKYYNAILQNLFFACLNNPIDQRGFVTDKSYRGSSKDFGVKNLFRDNKNKTWFKKSKQEIVDVFKQVPFLNGGLFECLDKITDDNKILYYDGFSRDEKTEKSKLKRAFIPNALFFAKDKGIISILERYNFTVEENSVDDVEVALDPELLGKVFENLLAAYNPETKETARKKTGSFYTPREIVDFMVDQSLIQYLVTHNKDISKDDLNNFVLRKSLPVSFTKKKIVEISEQIKSVKILDPACGSGAYPMGILNKLYELLTLLGGEDGNHYQNKLALIENCIYGVDIQSIAVQISKLRFFISLIVEQNPTDKLEDNYGIKSLPNLETKFVAANTLIGLKQNSKDQLDLNDTDLLKMKEELWNIRNHQNFNAKSFDEKKKLRVNDKALCEKIKKYIHKNSSGPNLQRIKDNLAEIAKAEKKLVNLPVVYKDFTEKYSQTKMFEDDSVRTPNMFKVDVNEVERNKLTNQIAALKKEIKLEQSKKGTVDTEEADNLINWDPYDQNASSPFFDPEWMFGIESFDIVIGNPPYVNVEKIDKKIKDNISDFRTAYQKYDLYVLFYEKGISLLKNNGVLSFITSNKFLSQGYGLRLRELFLEYNLNLIVNFNYDIFESATVRTCILQISKSCFENTNKLQIIDVETKIDADKFYGNIYKELNQEIFYNTDQKNFRINLNNKKIALLDEIKEQTICLEEICSVNYGLRPNSEKLNLKKEHFIHDSNPNKKFVPYFEGKDMGYWLVKEKSFLDYQPDVMYNAMFKELFENNKLVGLRTLSDIGKLRFIYDKEGLYCNDSVVILTLWKYFEKIHNSTIKKNITKARVENSKKFHYNYLQAILNSKVIKFYFNELMYDGTHFYPNHMKSLPIKKLEKNKQEKFITIVDTILKKQKDQISVIDHVKELDFLVCKLYDIKYKDLSVIDPHINISKEDYDLIKI